MAADPKYNPNAVKFQEMSQDKMPGRGSRASTPDSRAVESRGLEAGSHQPQTPGTAPGAAKPCERHEHHLGQSPATIFEGPSSQRQQDSALCAGTSLSSADTRKSPLGENQRGFQEQNHSHLCSPPDQPRCPLCVPDPKKPSPISLCCRWHIQLALG